MKSLLKFLFFAGVITAVIVVVTNKNRKNATAPAGGYPTPWSPPTVAPTPAAETPAPPAPEVPEVPDWESSADPNQELEAPDLAALIADAEVADHEPVERVAEEPATADALAGTPRSEVPTWVAPSSSDEILEAADVAALLADAEVERAAEAEAPNVEVVDDEALAEVEGLAAALAGSAAEAIPETFTEPVDLDVETPWEAVAEEPAELEIPPAAELVPPAEVESHATQIEAEAKEPDFLTKYFEELAATPEETAPDAPAAPPNPPEAVNNESFLASVEEALDDLEPAPIIPPPRRTAESYLDEGNVYFNVGQYSLAIERYGQAVALDGSLTAAYYNRANAHTRAGDFEKALADYDRALELQPEDADALNNRGMLHLYRANYPGALKDFNQALQADPTDTTVMVNRGLANLHGGNAAAALVDFREAAAMDSNDAAAQYGAAQASASLGNRDEALKHVARALELDPGYAREAAADQHLVALQGDEEFLKLLRQSGSRPTA